MFVTLLWLHMCMFSYSYLWICPLSTTWLFNHRNRVFD